MDVAADRDRDPHRLPAVAPQAHQHGLDPSPLALCRASAFPPRPPAAQRAGDRLDLCDAPAGERAQQRRHPGVVAGHHRNEQLALLDARIGEVAGLRLHPAAGSRAGREDDDAGLGFLQALVDAVDHAVPGGDLPGVVPGLEAGGRQGERQALDRGFVFDEWLIKTRMASPALRENGLRPDRSGNRWRRPHASPPAAVQQDRAGMAASPLLRQVRERRRAACRTGRRNRHARARPGSGRPR